MAEPRGEREEVHRMADQAGIALYPILMACDHKRIHPIDGSLIATCRQCSRQTGNIEFRQIVAFELREWHMKCQQCRAGKWTGKDETAAYRAKANHVRMKGHYQVVVDFMTPDHVKRAWRQHYGMKRTPARFMPKRETADGSH